MRLRAIAKTDELEEVKAKLVDINGIIVGVYRFRDKFFAYKNTCQHRGGPVCEGIVIGKVECAVSLAGRRLGEFISDERMGIVCPWHGVQYDLETGVCWADPRLRLRKYEVSVRGKDIMIDLSNEP